SAGTYNVKLVVTNANGCKDSTTQAVTFSLPVTAGFLVNNSVQCVNNSFIFTNNSSNAVTYLWNFGDGSTSVLTSSTKNYTSSGVFTVKLFASNSGGCIDSSTTTVTVNAKPTAIFTYIGATTCTSNLTLNFSSSSLGSSSYFWTFGDGSTSTSANPVKTYLSLGTYTIKLVEINSNGCKDSTTQVVTFSSPLGVSFTTNNTLQCVGSNFVFTNTSSNAISYLWNFGDGTTSTLVSPSKIYSLSGIYTVKLFASNTSGCIDSLSTILTVIANPTASFTYTGNTTCTNNLTLVFNNTSNGAVSNNWEFGDGTVSSVVNPTKTYASTGTYIVKLVTVNVNGCKDSTIQTITINNAPVAAFNIVGSANCSNSLGIVLNNTSTGNIVSYDWSFGDGTTSTVTSPTKVYTTAGNYILKLIVTGLNGCKDSTSQIVNVSTKPTASFTIPVFDSCSNTFALNLANTSTNASSYLWSFSDGTTSIATSLIKTFSSAGTYTIKLLAINSNGCKDSVTQTATLLPKPIANFVSTFSSVCLGNNIAFTNTSSTSSNSSYYWDFGDGTTSTLQNPIKSYITNGTFKVLMFVTNTNGCKDSISKLVTITTKPLAAFTIPNYNSCSNGGI
ncbi:MAG: PKD domain-containing protein, partial [Dolichospermum sp.]